MLLITAEATLIETSLRSFAMVFLFFLQRREMRRRPASLLLLTP